MLVYWREFTMQRSWLILAITIGFILKTYYNHKNIMIYLLIQMVVTH